MLTVLQNKILYVIVYYHINIVKYEKCKYLPLFLEPKPPRSSSQDERGGASLWNEERPVQPIQHISNIPGINLSLNAVGDYGGVGGNVNENECVLHVICSPLVSNSQTSILSNDNVHAFLFYLAHA